ncbi:MAG: C25 family cysteine peptidase [Bacteroidetes bacterium]|nr:C25 family cysteine peptidase [Bacteroidota bacterium]
MLKRTLIVFIIALVIPFTMKAEWVSLNKSKAPNTPPLVSLIKSDNNSTVVKVEISGFDLKENSIDGKKYQSVDLLTDIFTTLPGYPELAYIAKVLAVPDQAGITLEILETSNVLTFQNIHLQPARESRIEGKLEPPFIENAGIYQSKGVFPQEFAQLDPPSVFRDFRITRLSVFPLRYSAAKNELQAITSITIRIKYGHGAVINPKTTPKKAIAPSFGKLYRSTIMNYKSVLDSQFNGEESGHEVMLCIMPDQYVATFQPYADWKRRSGTDVHITKFSDIGANPSNPQIIKDHITNAYHNWEYPPTYVLVIGDNGVFPVKIINYDYSFTYDDFFVEIDGSDFFPEMMIGRIPNQNDNSLQVMINKFMKYEKIPYTMNTAWFKKGIVCSNNSYASQIETKRYTAKVMMQDGGFTSVDTLMSDAGCSMDLSDIISTINNGRSYLNYRGEGWTDGWMANCYNFLVSDVSSLNNGEKLTFVTSIGCGVAQFTVSGGNCFGEEWLKLGTTTSGRGAIAFVGPTSNTHTAYNNQIDRGIYKGMFQEGMDTPGQALLRGKLNMYNVFGSTDPWVEYQYRVFHVLGDPSVHIWKDVPYAVNVGYPTTVPLGFSQPSFSVTYASTGLPVKNAEVCLTGSSLFTTGYTDSLGIVTLDITTTSIETLSLTVRGGNVIPFLGNITVSQGPEYISPFSFPEIIDISGNLDGLINPGENGHITFTLKNWGTIASVNVQATLSVVETNYAEVITTNAISFGNLNPGDTFTGNPFHFYIKPGCPTGQTITFVLYVTSSTNSWYYYYYQEVVGCHLAYKNNIVDDQGSLNHNYRMDPGEIVKVFLTVQNSGEDVATDVLGILKSNDPYITIIDSTASFGTIEADTALMNTGSPFQVSIAPSCPTGYLAEFSVKLSTQNGNYPYQTIHNFSIPIGTPGIADFTGPDAYGYYAFGSNDTLFEQAPVYNWMELNGITSPLVIPNYISEYTTTVNLPFTFKYYGINYTQLRISTDGWIAFGNGSQTASVNAPLPSNDNINCMVAAFWDDLYSLWPMEPQNIYYYDDATNHRFIVEWNNLEHNDYSFPTNTETFQAILLNPLYYPTPTGDGEIIVQFNSVENSHSCTVGIENHTQNVGLQYVYNDTYDTTAASLKNAFAIKFTTKPPFVLLNTNEVNPIPINYCLGQNYPNPFTSTTTISITLLEAGNVSLKVYNIRGELVRTLLNGEKPSGKYTLEWDGSGESGTHLSPGMYFYRLQNQNITESKKMFILK